MAWFWLLACGGPVLDSGGTFSDTELQGSATDTDEVIEPASEERWAEAVSAEAILAHIDALEAIGAANGNTRVAGSSGYDDSVAYVSGMLDAAGYDVEIQDFEFSDWTLEDATLSVDDEELMLLAEFYVLTYSGVGEASGPLAAVDLELPPGDSANSSTSGCESEDFDDFPAGAVALIQRGACTFSEKVDNAVAAGAVGVLVFNEGQSGRTDVFAGELSAVSEVPALTLSFSVGEALAEALDEGDVDVTLAVEGGLNTVVTQNVMASWPGTGDDEVVIGAHLDSVAAGPGINDNGSGSALILTMAEAWAAMNPTPVQDVRFAWWGAEEWGLLGSFEYIDSLSEDQLDRTMANLNFDMVASPNPVRFVYDGDGSDTTGAGPTGSARIEELFTDYFDAQGLEWEATAFDGRSDYGPFIWSGIPAGGLFTGAEGIMSHREAARFEGEADEPYDACYHEDCDNRDNVDAIVLDEMADASVHVSWALLMEESPLAIGRRARVDPATAPVVGHGHCGHPPTPKR